MLHSNSVSYDCSNEVEKSDFLESSFYSNNFCNSGRMTTSNQEDTKKTEESVIKRMTTSSLLKLKTCGLLRDEPEDLALSHRN